MLVGSVAALGFRLAMSRRDNSPEAAPPAARGRPVRSPLDTARAKSWARAVVQASGLSLRALDRHCQVPGSGQWSKYVAGRVSPTAEKLAIVDAVVPGSSRYYLSPLWDLLDPDSLGRFGPRQVYEWLDEPLRSTFCLPSSEDPLFWRVQPNIEAEFSLIMKLAFKYEQPFDVVAALLGCTHEAITSQNRERLAYASASLWYLCGRLDNDVRMLQGLWAVLPERRIHAFARRTLVLAGNLELKDAFASATRNIQEIQRISR